MYMTVTLNSIDKCLCFKKILDPFVFHVIFFFFFRYWLCQVLLNLVLSCQRYTFDYFAVEF